MELSTFPSATYWYTSVVIAIVVAIIAGIITKMAEGKVRSNRALVFILFTIGFAIVSYWVMFWGISQTYTRLGIQRENSAGCLNALNSYKMAINWNPHNGYAQAYYSSCMIDLNRSDEALSILRPLQDIQADDWVYWYSITILNIAMDDFVSMHVNVNRMLALNPQSINELVDIGRRLHSNLHYDEAESILRIVRMRNDNNNDAIFWLAWTLYEQGSVDSSKYYDALHHFDECINRFQEGYYAGRCHAGKGYVYLSLGQRGDAIAEFNIALQITPEQDDVRIALNNLLP